MSFEAIAVCPFLFGAAVPDWLHVTWNVVLVILGVNALIIVHEFGHFIVARMCGVRCDKFYIWFDIYGLRFFRFKWGQTEYGLGVLPLGGYVKMFGQEDNPGQIAKEIEKARTAAARQAEEQQGGESDDPSGDGSGPSREELAKMETALYAKDSYLSKSVPQRMAIISAGVIMNILFAIFCASVAYYLGVNEIPCAVGAVAPGSPAWVGGLQVGDRILQANGRPTPRFGQLAEAILDGDLEQGIKLTIERPGVAGPFEKMLVARKEKGALIPTIGIGNLSIPQLIPESPFDRAAKEEYPETVVEGLKGGETLLAIDGQPVESFADVVRLQYEKFDEPLRCEFRSGDPTGEKIPLTLPPLRKKELGLRFKIGEITTVKAGSPAQQAGIERGDILTKVDGDKDFDPIKLPQQLLKKYKDGARTVTVTIMRADGNFVPLELPIDPTPERLTVSGTNDGIACSPLGITYRISNEIAAVAPETTFAGPKSPVGARLEMIEFPDYASPGFPATSFLELQKKNLFWTVGFRLTGIGDRIELPFIYENLFPGIPAQTKVVLHLKRQDTREVYETSLGLSNDWYDPERGLNFKSETFLSQAKTWSAAARQGVDQTVDGALAVYRVISNIGRNVSAKAIGGPVTIVKIAYAETTRGLPQFLLFLCLIGANLAVLNILPIPVLDGGHLVFLAYEAIFRRPPNESIQIGLSYIGLFLILGLMLWAISLDFGWVSRF